MPAMPMAESSAPIVVGIRQTSSETSTMPVMPFASSAVVSGRPGCPALAKIASGCSVTVASRKMIVSEASRMFSAISFGVFCRLAPSTSAIIRSMKLSPGRWVISTTMRSRQHPGAAGDRVAVAAALADHRRALAGDRRLVHAGDALDDVPVTGDDVAGLAARPGRPAAAAAPARAPRRRADEAAGHGVGLGPAQRGGLGLAAALGHRLGQVGEQDGSQSQTTISHANVVGSATARTVVKTAPTSTRKITGLRHSARGSSLASAPGTDV